MKAFCGLPFVVFVICSLTTPMKAQSPWWQKAESENERFVTVDLTALYHGKAIGGKSTDGNLGDSHRIAAESLPPEQTTVLVGGIPFSIGKRDKGDHLDVGLAKWPEKDRIATDFYAHYGPKSDSDPEVPVVRVPKQNYSAAYLLCIADTNQKKTPVVSLRLGLHDKNGYLYDTSVSVPRWNESRDASAAAFVNVATSGEVRLADAQGTNVTGRVFVIRAPLKSGDTQELHGNDHLDLEITTGLKIAVKQPDPSRFRIRPLGLPSAVHVFALSLERSPIQMTVTSEESGNVFVQPQVPTFYVNLHNITEKPRRAQIEVEVTDYYGQTANSRVDVSLAANSESSVAIPLKQPRGGWFDIKFRLLEAGRQLLDRSTTFAILPRDTRKATLKDSPFGTWYFGTAHRGSPLEQAGPLMQKAGVRNTLERGTAEELKRYGLKLVQFDNIVGSKVDEARKKKTKERFARWPDTDQVLVFHESNIGPIMTYPAFLLGKKPAPLDEKTQQEFDQRWKAAVISSQMVRDVSPRIRLVFGNMTMPAVEQYLSRGYPAKYIDLLGDESPAFMRMPERQPEVAGFASLWWLKEMAKHYGYADKPISVSYEWTYHGTSPGNNSERTASDLNIRDCLLALAYGVPHVNPALIHDVGNAYYFSNWGAAGLCRRPPELNPKPGYVSFATMTLLLDQAKFSKKLPTGSTSVFALEFTKPNNSKVTTLWTILGEREVKLSLSGGGEMTTTDAMGNQQKHQNVDREVNITINSSPLYVTGAEITGIQCGKVRYRPGLAPDAQVVSPMNTLDKWQVVPDRDEDLEQYIWDQIRRPGKFRWETINDADRGNVIQISLDGKQQGPKTASFYNRFKVREPIQLSGKPKQLGLWVKGNSSWARITFELVDAEGESWSNMGAAAEDGRADWNTNDTESTTFVNFDGWRQLSVALPGHYAFGNYNWPRNCNWRHRGGNGRIDYPLSLTGLVVELREKLVYIDELVNATSRSIMLSELTCGEATTKDIPK